MRVELENKILDLIQSDNGRERTYGYQLLENELSSEITNEEEALNVILELAIDRVYQMQGYLGWYIESERLRKSREILGK